MSVYENLITIALNHICEFPQLCRLVYTIVPRELQLRVFVSSLHIKIQGEKVADAIFIAWIILTLKFYLVNQLFLLYYFTFDGVVCFKSIISHNSCCFISRVLNFSFVSHRKTFLCFNS